jgi:dUTP pyrophosphatase
MIQFKKLYEDSQLPFIATDGSAGFDLFVYDVENLDGMHTIKLTTGIACAIPKGWVGQLVARSSAHRKGVHLVNKIGIIDSDYRGEIMAIIDAHQVNLDVRPGDRVLQLVVVPCLTECREVTELPETSRGSGGFGHSGL